VHEGAELSLGQAIALESRLAEQALLIEGALTEGASPFSILTTSLLSMLYSSSPTQYSIFPSFSWALVTVIDMPLFRYRVSPLAIVATSKKSRAKAVLIGALEVERLEDISSATVLG